MPFKRVDLLVGDKRLLGSLLGAVTQTFRRGLVFHPVRRIASLTMPVNLFCSPLACARIISGATASMGIAFAEAKSFIVLPPLDGLN
jgi:hypothetical protein